MTKRSEGVRIYALMLAVMFSAAESAIPALAGSPQDFDAAYAKAVTAERMAGMLKNQWTTTEQELKAAKQAADAGNFDDAVKHARQAEALAVASIAQANAQTTAWKQAVIH